MPKKEKWKRETTGTLKISPCKTLPESREFDSVRILTFVWRTACTIWCRRCHDAIPVDPIYRAAAVERRNRAPGRDLIARGAVWHIRGHESDRARRSLSVPCLRCFGNFAQAMRRG